MSPRTIHFTPFFSLDKLEANISTYWLAQQQTVFIIPGQQGTDSNTDANTVHGKSKPSAELRAELTSAFSSRARRFTRFKFERSKLTNQKPSPVIPMTPPTQLSPPPPIAWLVLCGGCFWLELRSRRYARLTQLAMEADSNPSRLRGASSRCTVLHPAQG